MDTTYNFTLRQDLFPITVEPDKREIGPKEIHVDRFPTLDSAFVQLYRTPVEQYDEAIALKHEMPYFLKDAAIWHGTGLQPCLKLDRLFLPNDHVSDDLWYLPNAAIQLTGNPKDLFSKQMQGLLRRFNPEAFQQPFFPIAVYNKHGDDLYMANARMRERMLNAAEVLLPENSANTYYLTTRYQAYYDKVPKGEKQGVIVQETQPYFSIKAALTKLLDIEFDSLDTKIAASNQRPQAVLTTSVQDVNSNNIISLNLYNSTGPSGEEAPGLYFTYNIVGKKAMLTEGIPIYTIAGVTRVNSHRIAMYNKDSTHLKPTDQLIEFYRQLKGGTAQTIELQRHKNLRPVPGISDNSLRV